MRAEGRDDADVAVGITEGDEIFAKNFEPDGGESGSGTSSGSNTGEPEATEESPMGVPVLV